MRLQLHCSVVVPGRGAGRSWVRHGSGYLRGITLTPEQAQQFASDIMGAAIAASRNVDGPVLVTPDQLPEFCRVCL